MKVSALQNLVKVMSLYYQYMEEYMGPALFAVRLAPSCDILYDYCMTCQITLEAMKSDNDNVALQGVEFWSTVCDEEQDLAIEAAEVCSSTLFSAHHHQCYRHKTLAGLLNTLASFILREHLATLYRYYWSC